MTDISKQTFEWGNRRWFVTRLIAASKDLRVHRAPLAAINTYELHPKVHDMADFVSHIRRVNDADLSKPIILDDEGYVMDGRHRIAKALLEGRKTIKFVRFDVTPQPCFRVGD